MRRILSSLVLMFGFAAAHGVQAGTELLDLEWRVAERTVAGSATDTDHLSHRLQAGLRAAIAAAETQRARKLHALIALSGNDPAWRHPFSTASDARRLQLSRPHGQCVGAHSLDLDQTVEIDHLDRGDDTDIWFGFVAPEAGLYVVSSIGSRGDTQLDVWQSCGLRPGELLGSSDDYYGLHAALPLRAERAGQRFAIRFRNQGKFRSDRLSVLSGGIEISGQVTTAVPTQDQLGVSAQSEDGAWVGGAAVNPVDGSYTLLTSDDLVVSVRTYTFFDPAGLLMLAHPEQGCLDYSNLHLGGCGDPATWSQFGPDQAPHAGVDFHLPLGATVGGLVIDRQSGTPVKQATAVIRILGSDSVRSVWTDEVGRYVLKGLPEYGYTIEAHRYGYLRQLHQNINCPADGCDPELGTIVSPVVSQPTAVNFQLDPSARLFIDVSGLPPSDFVIAQMLDAAGATTGSAAATADQSGYARISVEQAPGPFRLFINSQRTVSQVYPDLGCSVTACTGQLTGGTLLQMPESGQLLLSMQAVQRPRLSGRITDASDGSPITDASIFVFGERSEYASTDADGNYVFPFLHPGVYQIRVGAPRHIDEAYPDVHCQGLPIYKCPGVQTITLELEDLTGIDMDLDYGGVIRGRVQTDPQTSPMVPYDIHLFALDDPQLFSAKTTTNGAAYAIYDLLPGQYRVGMTGGSFGAFPLYPMLYDGVYCDRWVWNQPAFSNCSGPGDILEVELGQVIEAVDFLGYFSDARAIKVARADTAEPIAGVVMDMWTPEGDYIDSAVTNAAGFVLVGAFPAQTGTAQDFLLSTSNGIGLIDEVYDDISCPEGAAFFGLCSLAGATPISNWSPAPGSPLLHLRLLPAGSDALWVDGFED